jgi:ABC-type Mn2+/Zn2+ transport system permease subunit
VYVVLRRVVFVGVALAELSSAGIALGLLLGFAPIAGALVFMAAGVVLFSLRWAPRRVPHESVIGVVYLVASALSVLMIAKSAQGETFMLKLMQGDVLLTDAPTVAALAIAAAGIGVAHALFGKEFVLVSFDHEAAATLGLRASSWELFLMGTIGLAIAFSIHAVGVLLTASLLVLPAATALLCVRSLRAAFILAPILALIPVLLGLHLSFVADYPASAVVVVLSFLMFIIALALRRGQ